MKKLRSECFEQDKILGNGSCSIAYDRLACTPSVAQEYVNIGTGPTGGTYYPVGSGIAKIWSDNVPDLKATAQASGGTRNNIQLMEAGDAEVIFADGLYYDAYNLASLSANRRNSSALLYLLS